MPSVNLLCVVDWKIHLSNSGLGLCFHPVFGAISKTSSLKYFILSMVSKTDEYFPLCFTTIPATLLLLLVAPFFWCPSLAMCSQVIVWCNCPWGSCRSSHREHSVFSFFCSFPVFTFSFHQILPFVSWNCFSGVLSIYTVGDSNPGPHSSSLWCCIQHIY